MISSISNNLTLSELLATKQATKTSTDSEGKETVDTTLLETEAAPKTDTLEISPEGLAAAYAQTSTDTDSSATTDASTSTDAAVIASIASDETETATTTTSTTTSSEVAPPPPAPPASSTEETEETDTSTTKNLSSYTEEELDALVEDGTITEAEKNTELASREMEESLDKNNEKMLEQLDEADEAKGTKPPKPEDEAKEDLPPVGDDLALTEGAATEDSE